MGNVLRTAWARWKKIAEAIGHFQARLIFGILYVIVAGPFALGLRAFADPLAIGKGSTARRWRPLSRQTLTLDAARRQF